MNTEIWTETSLPNVDNDCLIARGQTHIFCGYFDDFGRSLESYRKLLSEDERKRAERYKFDKDRARYAITRGVLRTILSEPIGYDPDELEFTYGDKGKPLLYLGGGEAPFGFNVSHTEGMFVIAVSPFLDVGVDIEQIREVRQLEGVANRFFSESEKQLLAECDDDAKVKSFFSLWTKKEAYLKACGDGLWSPLDSCSFTTLAPEINACPAQEINFSLGEESSDRWSIYSFCPDEQFMGALAVWGRVRSVRTSRLMPTK